MVPTGNVSPEWWSAVNVSIPQLSLAVGSVHDTAAPQIPGSLFTVMSLGQPLITGFSVSFTVTSKLQVVTLPWMSVAV